MRTIAGNDGPQGREHRLPSHTVEVWWASLDEHSAEAVDALRSLLSPDEVARTGNFRFERDQRRYLVGRAVLRLLLGRYLGCAPRTIAFHYGPCGKPTLAADTAMRRCAPQAPALHFNLAHSEALAVYAFTRDREIGVDVERVRDLPDWERMAEAIFCPRELAGLRSVPAERRRKEFFATWTRREALLKALGTGLGGERREEAEAAYCVRPLRVGDGFAAALAIPPTIERIVVRTWRGNGATHPVTSPADSAGLVAMGAR